VTCQVTPKFVGASQVPDLDITTPLRYLLKQYCECLLETVSPLTSFQELSPLVTISSIVIIQEYHFQHFRISGATALSTFNAISFLFTDSRTRHMQTQLHNILGSLENSISCFRLLPHHQVHWREDAFPPSKNKTVTGNDQLFSYLRRPFWCESNKF
jgi:hypothetical protein